MPRKAANWIALRQEADRIASRMPRIPNPGGLRNWYSDDCSIARERLLRVQKRIDKKRLVVSTAFPNGYKEHIRALEMRYSEIND